MWLVMTSSQCARIWETGSQNAKAPMQHLSKAELIAARYDLRRAGIALGRVRGVFISAGAARDAAAINMMIDKLTHLIARIDKVLAAKP